MTACPSPLAYRPLRAPREDRAALIEPPFAAVGRMVAENVRQRGQSNHDFHGRSLADLTRQARGELLDEARGFSAEYGDLDLPHAAADGLIFLAGHQPQLFHPGVWWKNFALDHLARRHRAAAVNLVIDSDTVKSTSLRVPGGSVRQPSVETIPFDELGPTVPYEQRPIVDRASLAAFGRRAADRIAPLVADPLVETYWPLVLERSQHTDNLGACLAQSRHQLEARWGLATLEIPQSRVCDTQSFRWFIVHLLDRLPQLRQVYNESVREYRRVHHIRSTAHPVPDLSAAAGWIEAPLWVFSDGDPRRRALFARRRGDEILLSDRQGLEVGLPLAADGDPGPAVARLADLRRGGVKVRSRALMTTLWARLVLGDLFLHGIGGAKYDHLTDALMERFFGIRAPGFMVLSATLLLPVERARVTAERSRTIQRQLRELTFHPEHHLDGIDNGPAGAAKNLAEMIAAKDRWIRTQQTCENARVRCQAIRRINEALQPALRQRREQLQQELADTARALRAEAVLSWREYGFCLYPEEALRGFFSALLPKSA